MFTSIQKWGNSQAVRLPKALLEQAGLKENDKVEIKLQNNNLMIIPLRKHRKLEERIAGYRRHYRGEEWDTGDPAGKEVF